MKVVIYIKAERYLHGDGAGKRLSEGMGSRRVPAKQTGIIDKTKQERNSRKNKNPFDAFWYHMKVRGKRER